MKETEAKKLMCPFTQSECKTRECMGWYGIVKEGYCQVIERRNNNVWK